MTTYYKVTNVSARSEKGERNIFLIEAGRLLKPGETLYNLRRVHPQTKAKAKAVGLEVLEQNRPFKEPGVVAPANTLVKKPKHIVHKAPEAPAKAEAVEADPTKSVKPMPPVFDLPISKIIEDNADKMPEKAPVDTSHVEAVTADLDLSAGMSDDAGTTSAPSSSSGKGKKKNKNKGSSGS